jgi:trimethylamine--corrinoid protein Co-methyltransferase
LGGCTDAKLLDQQAGMEATISLATALLNGANIVHDAGFMDSGLQGSLQLLVIANETLGFLRAATRGVVVDDETLALDVVDELGPEGSYMQHPHTLRHYKEPFYSNLFEKGTHAQWQKKGALSTEQRAARVVDDILASQRTEPLSEDAQRTIQAIVTREQEWIERRK